MDIQMGNRESENQNLLENKALQLNDSRDQHAEEQNATCRQLIAFWFFGLCNNYSYVIMLSAAHDILAPKQDFRNTSVYENSRDCNPMSTSAILIADVIPSLMVKLFLPYFDLAMDIHVVLVCGLSAGSFLLVGLSKLRVLNFVGVVMASLSSGCGELSFLGYSSYYHRNVVSAYSSGTGASGVLGALSYAFLLLVGLSLEQTILLMLFVPVLMAVMFWGFLDRPESSVSCPAEDEVLPLKEKFQLIPRLLPYMAPLFFVYMAEYFINQGLLELIWFSDLWLDHHSQYRWFQVNYQIGVMISRSSVNLIHIKKIWIFAVLQFLNVAILLTDALWWYIPSFWIVMVLVLWEGLLGGAAYVNMFFTLSADIEKRYKKFAMSASTIADASGIVIAGLIGMPVHNAICNLPSPDS